MCTFQALKNLQDKVDKYYNFIFMFGLDLHYFKLYDTILLVRGG